MGQKSILTTIPGGAQLCFVGSVSSAWGTHVDRLLKSPIPSLPAVSWLCSLLSHGVLNNSPTNGTDQCQSEPGLWIPRLLPSSGSTGLRVPGVPGNVRQLSATAQALGSWENEVIFLSLIFLLVRWDDGPQSDLVWQSVGDQRRSVVSAENPRAVHHRGTSAACADPVDTCDSRCRGIPYLLFLLSCLQTRPPSVKSPGNAT